MQTIGKRLRLLRGIRSQGEVVEQTGISSATLSSYEHDKFEPKAKTVVVLAKYYGVTTDYILLGEGEAETVKDNDNMVKYINELAEYVNAIVKLNMKLEARVTALEEKLMEV